MDETDDDDDGADRLDRLASADVDPTADPAETIARVWCRFADPEGRGRSGRAAHAPARAPRAPPRRAREALARAAPRRRCGGGRREGRREGEDGDDGAGHASGRPVGWGAAAEAAADRPGEALNAARRPGRRARRARERPSAGGIAPRAQAAERRLRVVSAEALRSGTPRGGLRGVPRHRAAGPHDARARGDARATRAPVARRAASAFGPARPARQLGHSGGRRRRGFARAACAGARVRARLARPDVDSLNGQSQENVDADVAAARRPFRRAAGRRARPTPRTGVATPASGTRARARGPGSARAALSPRRRRRAVARDGVCALALVYAASGMNRAACVARAWRLTRRTRPPGPRRATSRAPTRETERVCERALAVSSRCSGRRFARAHRGAARGYEAAAAARPLAAADAGGGGGEALGASYDAMDKHWRRSGVPQAMDVEAWIYVWDPRRGSTRRRGRGGSSPRRRATWTRRAAHAPRSRAPATRRRRSAWRRRKRARGCRAPGAARAAARRRARRRRRRQLGRPAARADPRRRRARGRRVPGRRESRRCEFQRRLALWPCGGLYTRRAGDAAPRRGVVRPRRGVRRFRRRAGAGGERVRALRAFRERLSCLLARRARVAVPSRVSAPGPREPGGVGRARDAPSGGRRRERRVFFTEERRARRERREARRLGAAPARPRATRDGTRARHTPGPLERARVGGARARVRRRRA